MKNLSQKKRTQLLGVIAVTVLSLAGIWFGLIGAQKSKLATLTSRKERLEKDLQQVNATIRNAPKVSEDLEETAALLEREESKMASGDLYSWAIATLRDFKQPYKIEIPQFSQIDGPKPANLMPQFPYQQASLSISGSAQFFEFGRFVADLENKFPHIRLVNLALEPAGGTSTEPERLTFKVDVIALVKPSNS